MKKKKNDIGTFFTAPIVISLVIIALIVLMSIFAPKSSVDRTYPKWRSRRSNRNAAGTSGTAFV